eukprot:3837161-Heterocapsa_arctica.AAC.1
MDRIALHSEVPVSRTCAKGPSVTPGNLGDLRKDTLNCITCAAQATTSFFKYEKVDVKSSAIVQHWKDMKKGHNFDKLTKSDRIAILAAFMIDKNEERAALSKLGASRLSREEVIRFLNWKQRIQNCYTLM